MKIVHSLKYSCLLIKGFIEKFENKAKEQKGGFFSMLFGALGASLEGNISSGEGIPSHTLTNSEIQIYYQSKPKLSDIYSRNSFRKIKYGAYVINLDEYKSIPTHWATIYATSNLAT